MKTTTCQLIAALLIAALVLPVLAGCAGPETISGNERPATTAMPEVTAEPTPEATPAPTDTPAPTMEPDPITYVTNNKVFALDIPCGLEMRPEPHSGNGDHIKIESLSPEWTIHFYEHTTDGGFTYKWQKNVVVKDLKQEITPITIAGKEGYYFLQDSSPGIFIDVKFPNPSSDDKKAIYGTVWIFMDPIAGYETADYLEIPEIKAILSSIRAAE